MTAVALLVAVAAVTASDAGGEQPPFRRGGRGRFGYAMRTASPDSFDGGFNFCRIMFNYNRYGDGGGWNVDYPRADINLSIRLSELTKTRVAASDADEPESPRPPADRRTLFQVSVHHDDGGRGVVSGRGRGEAPARLPAEGRVSLGRRLLGQLRLGRLGERDRARCCHRASFRSWTCRSTTRSSARSSTIQKFPQIPSIGGGRQRRQHVRARRRQRRRRTRARSSTSSGRMHGASSRTTPTSATRGSAKATTPTTSTPSRWTATPSASISFSTPCRTESNTQRQRDTEPLDQVAPCFPCLRVLLFAPRPAGSTSESQ